MSSIRIGLTRALLGALLLCQHVLGIPGDSKLLPRVSVSMNVSASTANKASTAATTCNGRPEYCTRSYSNITFMGSHDSPFVGELPQQNQNIDIQAQLNMGIRFLQAQTHHAILDTNVLELCHTSCWLEDAGTLEAFLVTVKTWLDDNPNEVVTLLLTNGDSVAITEFGDTFTSSGIDSYAFVPSSSPDTLAIGSWPTIGNMIASGKRLVVFLDYGADASKVDYILDEFNYYFETPYDVTNSSFPDCSINRPAGASSSGRMYIVNHFLDLDILGVLVPDRKHAAITNAETGEGSLGAQALECEAIYGRAPNAMLADFVDKGSVIASQNALNGF